MSDTSVTATAEGIALRCAAHNLYEAELEFGVRRPPQERGVKAQAQPLDAFLQAVATDRLWP